ncbi:hypothetical protein HRbin36_01620 [bacterium HR36]|nr:hypothetical protein HRbin36_01620 [bacterium HR36]
MSRRRKAIATVELALCLPLLLVLMLGVWEIARYVEVQQVLNQAAREAGRQAAGGGKTADEVQQAVIVFLQSAGINPANVQVTITNLANPGNTDPRQASNLDALEVQIELPFRDVTLSFTSMFIPENAHMRARTVWRSLRDLPVAVDTNAPVE